MSPADRKRSAAKARSRARRPGKPAVLKIETPHGLACAYLHAVSDPIAALVLGHGASGGISARDLVTVTEVAQEAGLTVALVEQPYKVAGRRSPAPAPQLDAAWTAVVNHLTSNELSALPLIVGGRSLGARVACRTAADLGAVAVLCLAFPEHPPGKPEKTRQPELDDVPLPVLVVQGDSDPFGKPTATRKHKVVTVAGNHSLTADLDAVAQAVRDWLPKILEQVPAKAR